jgi:MSHA pilin protein MshB
MKSMTAMNAKRKQSGFTIIELVVVILLLGILTATALPRFMEVTDEAHDAVVDAVLGGLQTGSALFRAQWTAEGQPLTSDVSEFDLFASTAGYPKGLNEGTVTDPLALTDCAAVYDSLLQAGRPPAVSYSQTTAGTTNETLIEAATTANPTADVLAIMDATALTAPGINTTTTCEFYYVGQFKSGNATVSASIPLITYNFTTGAIAMGTALTLNTD